MAGALARYRFWSRVSATRSAAPVAALRTRWVPTPRVLHRYPWDLRGRWGKDFVLARSRRVHGPSHRAGRGREFGTGDSRRIVGLTDPNRQVARCYPSWLPVANP